MVIQQTVTNKITSGKEKLLVIYYFCMKEFS